MTCTSIISKSIDIMDMWFDVHRDLQSRWSIQTCESRVLALDLKPTWLADIALLEFKHQISLFEIMCGDTFKRQAKSEIGL